MIKMDIIMKVLSSVLALSLLGLPAFADDWIHTVERGIDTYEYKQGNGSVMFLCDPEGVWGGNSEYVKLALEGNDRLTKTIIFISSDGGSLEIPFHEGLALRSAIGDEGWALMIETIEKGSAFSFLTADEKIVVEAASSQDLSCQVN